VSKEQNRGEIAERECPKCHSKKNWKDGMRETTLSYVQRYLCKDCKFRFSEKSYKDHELTENSQLCVIQQDAKKLDTATEIKTVAGDKERRLKDLDLLPDVSRGLIIKFMAFMERNNFDEENRYPNILTHLAKDGANLLDPENVKMIIARQIKRNGDAWSDSMKLLATCAYDAFCNMEGIIWQRPKYRQNELTITAPDENDLDLLIANASPRMSTFLLCLKETFADPSEIIYAEWKDLQNNTLSINHPVKNHNAGKYELSNGLIRMLNALPQESIRIFPMTYRTAYVSLDYLRKRVAIKFQKPALKQISFKSFRHWGGSMLSHTTNGNVPIMARILRHKSWKSTMRYVHPIEFKDEDFEDTVATTIEEIRALGKAGWTKYDEAVFNGVTVHFYRIPKKFRSHGFMNDKSKSSGISNYNS
jgi:integrase